MSRPTYHSSYAQTQRAKRLHEQLVGLRTLVRSGTLSREALKRCRAEIARLDAERADLMRALARVGRTVETTGN